MSYKQIIIRIIAEIIFFLKREEIVQANSKFLIFTGTSGKTTMKDAVYTTLHTLNIPVERSIYGYNNELGVILTILGIQNFSVKNLKDWFRLFHKKVIKNRFICIELGADFYKDTKWFLHKFSPYGVFISASYNSSWSRDISQVEEDRRVLFGAVPCDGFIAYNSDSAEIKNLIKDSNIQARLFSFSAKRNSDAFVFVESWKNPFVTIPINEALNTQDRLIVCQGKKYYTLEIDRALFEPQVYSILATYICIYVISSKNINYTHNVFKNYNFSTDRLQTYITKSGATLIEDSYKAVPLCTSWFLNVSSTIIAHKKILILTEMRPLTFNTDYFYSQLGNTITFADEVYFIGPEKYFKVLKKEYTHIKHIHTKNYFSVANDILNQSKEGDLILLKGSSCYQLHEIRNSLIQNNKNLV